MRHPHLDVRRAVRTALSDLPDGSTVLVACSGGADSLSLAAATAWVAARSGGRVRAGGVCVDHGLQPGSANRARVTAAALCGLGLDPAVTVHVDASRGPDGPEGNARAARYAALTAAAVRTGAAAVLLGHTLDDQAETVLLGLARGSGPRSLSGMAARSGVFARPLLGLRRAVVRAALPDGLVPWDDPHNEEPAYARARVRHRVLPVLEAELGPGVAEALARTADLARADADALDEQADAAFAALDRAGDRRDREHAPPGSGGDPPYGRAPTALADDDADAADVDADAGAADAGGAGSGARGTGEPGRTRIAADPLGTASGAPRRPGVDHGETGLPGRPEAPFLHDQLSEGVHLEVAALAALPRAVRWRVLRRAAIAAGSPPTDLTAAHVAAVNTLVTAWRGQAGIDLPGNLRATRADGALHFTTRRGTSPSD